MDEKAKATRRWLQDEEEKKTKKTSTQGQGLWGM